MSLKKHRFGFNGLRFCPLCLRGLHFVFYGVEILLLGVCLATAIRWYGKPQWMNGKQEIKLAVGMWLALASKGREP